MAGLTFLDIIILLALTGGLINGFLRGFVQEVLSLAALLVALFALRLMHGPLTAGLADAMGGETRASMVAFALIMGVIWGGGKFAAMRIGSATRSSMIGPVDRLLGAGFGVLKALLIAATAFMLITMAFDLFFGAGSQRPDWMQNSRTYPLMRATSAALSDVVAQRLNDGRVDPAVVTPGRDAR
ncbi:MAG: CvpA family protein [Sphingopyxis sp.]